MKELTIEEKAKAYDEALERAEKALEVLGTDKCEGARQIFSLFPELKESEDERIRKAIHIYLDWLDGHKDYQPKGDYTIKDMIAWLEKQGKAEPKWCHHKVDLSGCSEEYRKAYYDGWNNCNQQHSQCKSEENDVVKCLINGMKFYYEGNEEATWGTEKFSMKVRDILFWLEKQGESYIKRDVDDAYVEGISQRMISAEAKEAMYDKPANTVEQKCEESKTKIFDAPTPFEDKLYAFVLACEILVDPSKREFILEHSQEILDAAREQIGKEQKSAEWSEEDEEMFDGIIADIQFSQKAHNHEVDQIVYEREIDWLNSLKDRYTWKPSDEQMDALKHYVDTTMDGDIDLLYQDLKELKGE